MSFSDLERYVSLACPQLSGTYVVQPEEQNSDYQSGTVELGGHRWRIRSARVTPTKPGAFVATWTRDQNGETSPFTVEESLSGLLVFVEDGEHFGVFRFTPQHLQELGYVTTKSSAGGSRPKAGKRGFRVYPSWSQELNAQATKTQNAQSRAFIQLT